MDKIEVTCSVGNNFKGTCVYFPWILSSVQKHSVFGRTWRKLDAKYNDWFSGRLPRFLFTNAKNDKEEVIVEKFPVIFICPLSPR